MKYLFYIKKILKILDKKTKFYLFLQLINLFLLAMIETISLGILAIYAGFLTNKALILEQIPSSFRVYLANISHEVFFFQVSIIIILLFIFKNIVILFSNWFFLRLKQRLLSKNSKEVFNQIINLDYEDFNKLNQSEILYKIINEISRVSSFIFTYNCPNFNFFPKKTTDKSSSKD